MTFVPANKGFTVEKFNPRFARGGENTNTPAIREEMIQMDAITAKKPLSICLLLG
jgi:hypothetical protein